MIGEAILNFVTAPSPHDFPGACATARRSLDPGMGHCLAAVFQPSGDQQPSRLFIAVHHLAIDGVSWRILLEDLASLLSGNDLPSSTFPFTNWANSLSCLAATDEIESQRNYWEKQNRPFHLPEVTDPTSRVAETKQVRIKLDPETSKAVLTELPSALKAKIDEILYFFTPYTVVISSNLKKIFVRKQIQKQKVVLLVGCSFKHLFKLLQLSV
jgi:hypothetical protein